MQSLKKIHAWAQMKVPLYKQTKKVAASEESWLLNIHCTKVCEQRLCGLLATCERSTVFIWFNPAILYNHATHMGLEAGKPHVRIQREKEGGGGGQGIRSLGKLHKYRVP